MTDTDVLSTPPDVLRVNVPFGARVLVAAELHLSGTTTPATTQATTELTQAVEAWTGPGLLIFNGGLFARQGTDVSDALSAHPRLVDSITRFAGGPGRRVVVLPGVRDPELAWEPAAWQALSSRLGAECALAVELHVSAGDGHRVVRVEPGHRYDELSCRGDPRNPAETPLAWHLREEMLKNLRRRGRPGGSSPAREPTSWLAGLDDLDDPAAFPRFVASRLTYRKLARHAWLLLAPFAAAMALRVPATLWRRAHGGLSGSSRLGLFVAATIVELVILAVLALLSIRRTWDTLANVALGQERRDLNQAPRAAARQLVTTGATGLITSHTGRPQLVDMGCGFYANTGSLGDTVSEMPSRMRGVGLPSVFVPWRQVSWVEIEAGAVLHVRLVHGHHSLQGATRLERFLARRPPAVVASKREMVRAGVVATYPHGAQGAVWPPEADPGRKTRLVRRAAAVFVAAAGFVSLISALSDPVRDRLRLLQEFMPIVVPEVATVLAALAGLGLLVLARGIRRGQRRAWVICQGILLAVAVLHLVKGVDVEETLVALAVAAFLWANRRSFSAASDGVKLRRGVGTVAGLLGAVLLAGTLGLQVGSLLTAGGAPARPGPHRAIGWGRAFLATAERLVGYQGVVLARRLDRFFAPAMATVGVCLALALAWLLLRPVVGRVSTAGGMGTARTLQRVTGSGRRKAAGAPPGPARPLARARTIVERYGSGTLDYFALRHDKQFFFWGSTVVAYAVYGACCLVSPDPVGPVAEREEAWRAFHAFADDQGWAVGVLGAAEHWLPVYRAASMHDLYVGDEGVVRVERFSLDGGRFKGLRQAVNRVAKYGYTISFHDPAELDAELRSQLQAVMVKSRRGDVERGFSMTLGRAFEPEDRGLLLAVVHGPAGGEGTGASAGAPQGPVVAFCQYVPAPGIGGYSLDLMRRDNGDHPNGLIDFAVVETIRYLKAHGYRGLGLNFATMRAVLAGEAGEGLSQKVQSWLLRRMGESMQIESLWRFNAKYDPDWQPRYAIYDAPENAISTAIAVARAESFWELPVIGRFLVPGGARDDGEEGSSQPAGVAGD